MKTVSDIVEIMKFIATSPTKAYITEYSEEELAKLTKLLTYNNTSAAHLVKRHYQNKYWRQSTPGTWNLRLEELKKDVVKVLVFKDDKGVYIRPGSLPHLGDMAGPHNTEILFKYPTPKKIPWAKPLPFELHPYQQSSADNLVSVVHGNVEICTGAGKSAILLKVSRETGFKTVIIAPSKSIFLELVEKFEHHFGKAKIGKFGDSKKVLGKQITICIGDSLANVKKDTKEWEFFSKTEMMCVDESHTWGAETLDAVCHGILADVPYRMFFSATQTRGDGAEKLLQSIIGKTVCTLTTKQAVDGDYICAHNYRIISVPSGNPNYTTSNALDMKRVHFLNNKHILNFAAKLANADALVNKRQTLILVEELSQLAYLLPLIKVPVVIAHSESKPARLAELGLYKVKPDESVELFNKGEAMVLIGTSCIATGTNIFPTHNTVNCAGGSSEIKTKQGAVGRSVRKMSSSPYKNSNAPKTVATIYDFDVRGIDIMTKHLENRMACYSESGSEIKYIEL